MHPGNRQNCVKLLFVFMGLNGILFNVVAQNVSDDPEAEPFNNKTPTWEETLSVFHDLASRNEHASLIQIGWSDVGRPIHAFILTENPQEIRNLSELGSLRNGGDDKLGLLINNAIHRGEPCGVDASI